MNLTDISSYDLRMHYRLCILKAINDGMPYLADAMIQLYRVQFPTP